MIFDSLTQIETQLSTTLQVMDGPAFKVGSGLFLDERHKIEMNLTCVRATMMFLYMRTHLSPSTTSVGLETGISRIIPPPANKMDKPTIEQKLSNMQESCSKILDIVKSIEQTHSEHAASWQWYVRERNYGRRKPLILEQARLVERDLVHVVPHIHAVFCMRHDAVGAAGSMV